MACPYLFVNVCMCASPSILFSGCARFCLSTLRACIRLSDPAESSSRFISLSHILFASQIQQGAKIPGGATLVFDVELLSITGSEGGKEF